MSDHDLELALGTIASLKLTACEARACTDLKPIVVVKWAGSGHAAATHVSNIGQIAPTVLGIVSIRPEHEVDWIAFLADVWVKHGAGAGTYDETLDEQLDAGDMSVHDAVTAHVVHVDETIEAGRQCYRYDDRGQPVFDEIEATPPDDDVATMLRLARTLVVETLVARLREDLDRGESP